MNKLRRSLLSILANNKIKYVKYLVGTGSQYMNTGLVGGLYRIELGAQATSIPDNGVLPIGAGQYFYLFFSTGDRTYVRLNYGNQLMTTNNSLIYHDYKLDGYNLYIDGEKRITVSSQASDGQLYLFKSSGYLDRLSTVKISYCRIYDLNTNELIRDYKPALDEDGRAGMYDAVSKTFTYSAVGEFEYEE